MRSQSRFLATLRSESIFEESRFEECHASTVESTPAGLVAAWFAGSHEKHKDVEIWISRRVAGRWTEPVSVADGVQSGGQRFPTWNPVLFQLQDGPLMLFYKVGPNPKAWWGMVKFSSDGGETWTEAQRLPKGVLGPSKNKPLLLNDGRLIAPTSTERKEWRIHLEISRDCGKTWEVVGPVSDPGSYNAIQPSILEHTEGTLQMLARSKGGCIVTSWSYDGGYTWSSLEPTTLSNPNSGIDAVTLARGIYLVVYNDSERAPGEWSGPRTPLNVAVSESGREWRNVATLEDESAEHLHLQNWKDITAPKDDKPVEFSYPAVIQSEDRIVHVTYTWKRKKIKHVALTLGKPGSSVSPFVQ